MPFIKQLPPFPFHPSGKPAYQVILHFVELESAVADLQESSVSIDDLEFVMVDSSTG